MVTAIYKLNVLRTNSIDFDTPLASYISDALLPIAVGDVTAGGALTLEEVVRFAARLHTVSL